MERQQAIAMLARLTGQNLRDLAEQHSVTVWKNGKINKGWAGHAIERYLGLPINSAQSPNFGSWELKIVPLKKSGQRLIVKETMAVTMIDPVEVMAKKFEDSHLLAKLRKAVICARVFEGKPERRSLFHSVLTFDLGDADVYQIVKRDYDLVRRVIKEQGFNHLTGKMGNFVQPRTKGQGHGSTSRAFYVRKPFLAWMLGLAEKPEIDETRMTWV